MVMSPGRWVSPYSQEDKPEVDKSWPGSQIWTATYFCMAMNHTKWFLLFVSVFDFYSFKWLKEVKRRIIFRDR